MQVKILSKYILLFLVLWIHKTGYSQNKYLGVSYSLYGTQVVSEDSYYYNAYTNITDENSMFALGLEYYEENTIFSYSLGLNYMYKSMDVQGFSSSKSYFDHGNSYTSTYKSYKYEGSFNYLVLNGSLKIKLFKIGEKFRFNFYDELNVCPLLNVNESENYVISNSTEAIYNGALDTTTYTFITVTEMGVATPSLINDVLLLNMMGFGFTGAITNNILINCSVGVNFPKTVLYEYSNNINRVTCSINAGIYYKL
jgi:hypothetical protein